MTTRACPPSFFNGRSQTRHGGFALVIVMFLLALILILVIAFAANMRTERKASNNMAQGQRADLIAEGALAHAVSLLANNIPDPTDPAVSTPVGSATNWLINPGQLTLVDSASPANVTRIPLHTGEAAAQDPVVAVNLNAQSPATQKYYMTGTNDPMWVSWVNVLQDASAPASKSNPIVGRYAFWIDDECAKINFNTARGKPDMTTETALPTSWLSIPRNLHSHLTPTFSIGSRTYALGQPASINLDALGITSSEIAELDTDVATNGYFVQPQAIKNYAANSEIFYEQNKFQLTPFSRSPEFNVFGKSRLFMSETATNLAAAMMYQHPSHPEQPVTFWGGSASVGNGKPNEMRQLREPVISALAKYLDRNDWPGLSGKSFRWTGGIDGAEESDQIALNIAAMGWWATTETQSSSFNGPYAQTLALSRGGGARGAFGLTGAPNGHFWKGPLSGRPILPAHPGPQLTEVALTLMREVTGTTGSWRLKFNLAAEFHLPPGYHNIDKNDGNGPGFHNASSNSGAVLSLNTTYFSIAVAGTPSVTNTVRASDAVAAATNAITMELPSFIPADNYIAKIGGTRHVSNLATGYFIIGQSGTANTPVNNTQKAVFSGSARVTVNLRLGIKSGGAEGQVTQMSPVYVPTGEEAVPAELRPPGGDDAESTLEFVFDLPATVPVGGDEFVQSLEISDPRLWAKKSSWELYSEAGDTDSLGFVNSITEPGATNEYGSNQASQVAMWNFSTTDGASRSAVSSNFRGSSIGMFSLVPTGMRRGIPWETLKFYNYTPLSSELPDWVILDLLAPSFATSSLTPISQRNSTAGKINLNTKIYPSNANFVPPARTAPLDAVFQNMPRGTQAANAIRLHQQNGGYFDYIGRICELPDIADNSAGATEYEKETLLRHLASILTTQSDTFSVWGVAQTVKKSPKNTDYGVFQEGDLITGERRFRAVVQRQVWTGKEGVPGNARIDENGAYVSVATISGTNPPDPGAPPPSTWAGKTWAEIDGPHEPDPPVAVGTVPHSSSTLSEAYNPLAAAMKYRIIFWEYLE
jgi:Tfp pilus assembly protein PilX